MGKDKTFAAKIAKASGARSSHCPNCGDLLTQLHVVENVKNDQKNSYKFKENFVAICSCNKKDYLG